MIKKANNKNLLVVDDEADLCESICFVFDDAGYQTFMAHNVLEAQKLLRQQQIDFVLTDIRLPDLSGIDLLRWIQDEPNIASQVVLISGYSDLDRDEGLRLGAKAVLKKPIELEYLFHVIEQLRRASLESSTND